MCLNAVAMIWFWTCLLTLFHGVADHDLSCLLSLPKFADVVSLLSRHTFVGQLFQCLIGKREAKVELHGRLLARCTIEKINTTSWPPNMSLAKKRSNPKQIRQSIVRSNYQSGESMRNHENIETSINSSC